MFKERKTRSMLGCVVALVLVIAVSSVATAGDGYFDWTKYDLNGNTVTIVN